MRYFGVGTAFLAAVAACSLAQAQTTEFVATPPIACELHLWPASGLNSVYSGWFHGGIVNGAVTGRDGYPAVPHDPLDTPAQVTLLGNAGTTALLKRTGDRVIVHDTALESRVIRGTSTRIDPSTAPCYIEIIVDDVFLQQDVVNGAYLKTLFRYRKFGRDLAPEGTFGTWVKTPLKLFPPKSPADLAATEAEFRDAYVRNIGLFGDALSPPPKGKKRG